MYACAGQSGVQSHWEREKLREEAPQRLRVEPPKAEVKAL